MRRQIIEATAEARLLARFNKPFGGPDETIVTIGDFEQRKHRKYREPIKGKGFRTLFRARPHPSPEPARWSASTSGRRAGANNVSGPCRTAREIYWSEPYPRGTSTCTHCTGGRRRRA
jgi:hypothetical protein